MGQLAGKVALVTGAGSGFGEGIATVYAREGARVVNSDINADALSRVAGDIGERAVPVHGDVSRREDVQRMVDAALERFGALDIVVNNAAITHRNQPMLDVDEAIFDR